MVYVVDTVDTGRDLLQFIVSYLPEKGQGCNLPTLLERQSALDEPLLELDFSTRFSATGVKSMNWRGRRIVLVGHSLGANASAMAVTSLPQLFEAVIFVDPLLVHPHVNRGPKSFALVASAVGRRDRWNTRAEAHALFLEKANFFGRWQSDVLDRYVDFGLEEDESGFKLKCDRLHEASVFADPFERPSLGYVRLRDLKAGRSDKKSSIPQFRTVYAGRDQSLISEKEMRLQIKELKSSSEMVRIEPSGHLVVQEDPERLSQHLARFLDEFELASGPVRGKL